MDELTALQQISGNLQAYKRIEEVIEPRATTDPSSPPLEGVEPRNVWAEKILPLLETG